MNNSLRRFRIKIINHISQLKFRKWYYKKGNSLIKLKKNNKLSSNNKNQIVLTKESKFKEGFYLFIIEQESNNREIYARINTKNNYGQYRRVRIGGTKTRIVKIKKNNFVDIELNNVIFDLSVKRIKLIKIPKILAISIVKFKCHQFFRKTNIVKLKFKYLWLYYNRYFRNESLFKDLIGYQSWIKYIEPVNKKLIKNTKNTIVLRKQYYNRFTPVNSNEWIVTIREGDQLSNDSSKIISNILDTNNNLEIIYPDEDHIMNSGKRDYPIFKTSWNEELFLNDPSYGRCWIIKGSLWNESIKNVKKINEEINLISILYASIQIIYEKKKFSSICHIPYILYHRQFNIERYRGANSKTVEVLKNYLKRYKYRYGNCKNITVNKKTKGHYIQWAVPKNIKMTIIIPFKDKVDLLEKCIDSIEKTEGEIEKEIILVNNNSRDLETYNYIEKFKKIILPKAKKEVILYKDNFNYSEMNNIAVENSTGDVIVLINNDIEITSRFWDLEIISNCLRPSIGCVGAKLYFPNRTIQHAGVIIGIGGVAGHAHKNKTEVDLGYESRLHLGQEYSALTGALLAISRKNWEKLGGMEEKILKVNYSDIDLCLKARYAGLKNIYIPNITAIHDESSTRGRTKGLKYKRWRKEANYFKKKWQQTIEDDPYYNPNQSLLNEVFQLSTYPRVVEKIRINRIC